MITMKLNGIDGIPLYQFVTILGWHIQLKVARCILFCFTLSFWFWMQKRIMYICTSVPCVFLKSIAFYIKYWFYLVSSGHLMKWDKHFACHRHSLVLPVLWQIFALFQNLVSFLNSQHFKTSKVYFQLVFSEKFGSWLCFLLIWQFFCLFYMFVHHVEANFKMDSKKNIYKYTCMHINPLCCIKTEWNVEVFNQFLPSVEPSKSLIMWRLCFS